MMLMSPEGPEDRLTKLTDFTEQSVNETEIFGEHELIRSHWPS